MDAPLEMNVAASEATPACFPFVMLSEVEGSRQAFSYGKNAPRVNAHVGTAVLGGPVERSSIAAPSTSANRDITCLDLSS
jgi:hypothetical protein